MCISWKTIAGFVSVYLCCSSFRNYPVKHLKSCKTLTFIPQYQKLYSFKYEGISLCLKMILNFYFHPEIILTNDLEIICFNNRKTKKDMER